MEGQSPGESAERMPVRLHPRIGRRGLPSAAQRFRPDSARPGVRAYRNAASSQRRQSRVSMVNLAPHDTGLLKLLMRNQAYLRTMIFLV